MSASFFVLRAPLLPFGELVAWAAGVAPDDRETLRARLAAIVARPDVQNALFLASPSLVDSLDAWRRDPDSHHGRQVERALVRYVERMCARPTPFGAFAGCALGRIEDAPPALAVAPRAQVRTHTRLDMDYVAAVSAALAADPEIRSSLRVAPSTSLYRAGDRWRVVRSDPDGPEQRARKHRLMSVLASDYLDATLGRACGGALPSELAAALVADDPEISPDEALAFVDELIGAQLLVSELQPPVTGDDPLAAIRGALAGGPREILDAVAADLLALDAAPLACEPPAYRAIADRLAALPAPVALARLFQVDLSRPAHDPRISLSIIDDLQRGIAILARIAAPRPEPFAKFRAAFYERYGEREVPLAEVLDDEAGIGFASDDALASDAAPLLEGIALGGDAPESPRTGPPIAALLRLLDRALRSGSHEVALTADDLAALASKTPAQLPDAYHAMATLVGTPAELAAGTHQILLDHAAGPSGAALLGRFCLGDADLADAVRAHIAAEEAARPAAVFAEIVHLPEGRTGNVLCRPVLRAHEIAYLGRSGAPPDAQLTVDDLRLSVQGERIVLRSAHLDREVIPRLTTAHDFTANSVPLYRFLCLLQGQGARDGLGWDWGALIDAPFLPRVTHGRFVFCRARWRLSVGECKSWSAREWRAKLGAPRFVLLADADNLLPIDFENALSIDAAAHLLRDRKSATLIEQFPAPDQLCAVGPEGAYTHELVVPFVEDRDRAPYPTERDRSIPVGSEATTGITLERGSAALRPSAASRPAPTPAESSRRLFAPGSAWVYAKLYAGPVACDALLRDALAPLLPSLLEHADGWFFLRYHDPDPHLRIRFHGDPHAIRALLEAHLAPLVRRFAYDTYDRELERYPDIDRAESLFRADSDFALTCVSHATGDDGLVLRGRLAIVGCARLLDDLALALPDQLAIVTRIAAGFAAEHAASPATLRALGDRFRKERPHLDALLAGDALPPWATDALAIRSAAIAAARPSADAAGSYLHMHANRMLQSAHRAQELALHDALRRLIQSRISRRS